MNKNLIYNSIGLLLCIVIVASSTSIGDTVYTNIKLSNREIYLGYATIWGDGNNSILNAVAENNLKIRTESTTEFVDLYIEYEMNCEGLVDEGIISLTLILNGENVSTNLTQTPFSKNGTLYLHDVEITRGESLGFVINVIYGNVYPFYHNDTSATGVAIVRKNFLLDNFLIQKHPFLSRFLRLYRLQVLFSGID